MLTKTSCGSGKKINFTEKQMGISRNIKPVRKDIPRHVNLDTPVIPLVLIFSLFVTFIMFFLSIKSEIL